MAATPPHLLPRLPQRAEAARLGVEDELGVVTADNRAQGTEVELVEHLVGEALDDVFDCVLDEEAHHISDHVDHNLEDPVQGTEAMDVHADVAEERRETGGDNAARFLGEKG